MYTLATLYVTTLHVTTQQPCDELSHQIVLIKVFIVFPIIAMIVIIVTMALWNVTLTLLEEEVLAKIHMCFH
jgi:hypothetical protein